MKTMRQSRSLIAAAALSALLLAAAAAGEAAGKRPNILFIMSDDHAYADVLERLKRQLWDLKEAVGDTDEKYPELAALRRGS